jgi:L-alanine-DL-glutamate epimerase-like enolase superfamily enzyme
MSRGLAGILIGQELDDPARLWDEMLWATQWHGRFGAVLHAISAMDIALWDLFAQSQNKPVWACLGAKHHDRLPAYATIYPLADNPSGIDVQVGVFLKQGFQNLKICVDPWWQDLDLVEQNLRHLRDLVGPDRGLMLDVALEWTTYDQLAPVVPLLEELDFQWIEAPFPLAQLDDHIALKKLTDIPVGVGDLGMTTCVEFDPYLKANALDIAQPDITMFGGLTEVMRLSKKLAGTDKRIIPQGYNSDITIATNLHFLAVQPQPGLVEYSTSPSLLRKELAPGLAPLDNNGMMHIPQGPGLGVRIDPKTFQRTRHL